MRFRFERVVLSVVLLLILLPFSASAQTPESSSGREWWTAWSDCSITPVQEGPGPTYSSSKPDVVPWLQAETTNDSEIELIVWLWSGNRPLPLDGWYAAEDMSTKWLWAFSERVSLITITATNESGEVGEVNFAGPLAAYDYQWPSLVVVPESGCWTFSIAATANNGDAYQGQVVFPAVP